MPELIWWDVIADRVSHRFAANVAGEIGKYFKGNDDPKKVIPLVDRVHFRL